MLTLYKPSRRQSHKRIDDKCTCTNTMLYVVPNTICSTTTTKKNSSSCKFMAEFYMHFSCSQLACPFLGSKCKPVMTNILPGAPTAVPAFRPFRCFLGRGPAGTKFWAIVPTTSRNECNGSVYWPAFPVLPGGPSKRRAKAPCSFDFDGVCHCIRV